MLCSIEIPVEDVRIGYILDENIIEDKVLLLSKGTVITSRHKELLAKRDRVKIIRNIINSVDYIDEKLVDQQVVVIDEEVKRRVLESVSQIFTTGDVVASANMAADVSRTLVRDILSQDGVGFNLDLLKVSDKYTFKHCVDVAAMGITLGKHLGLSESRLIDIGTAGILHDIGKLKVPGEILNKPGKLTEDEFAVIKNHPVFGYQMLMNVPRLSEGVRKAVLHHHEKYNGGGYPSGLAGDIIPMYARILCVVDVFDALVTRRPYHEPMPVNDAIETMYTMADQFDMTLLKTFLSCLVLYPVGSVVFLTNGASCQVIGANEGYPLRPIVKDMNTGMIYDLAKDDRFLTLKIADIREGINF